MTSKITLVELIRCVEKIANKQDKLEHDIAKEELLDQEKINNSSFSTIQKINFNLLVKNDKKNVSNFPKKLKTLLQPFSEIMYRHKVIHVDNKHNISLIYSFLYCIYPVFINLSKIKKIDLIKKFVNDIIKKIKSAHIFELYEYDKIGWTKTELIESLIGYKNDKLVLRLLSDMFSLNIFLFDIENELLHCVYPEKHYNKFKYVIMLSFYKNSFEPISYQNEKTKIEKLILDYTIPPLKKIITIDNKYIRPTVSDISLKLIEKKFELGEEDLLKYMDESTIDDSVVDEENIKDQTAKKEKQGKQEKQEKQTGYYDSDEDQNTDESDKDQDIEPTIVNKTENIFITKKENNEINETPENISKPETKPHISTSLKLADLQKIAKQYNINIYNGKTKSGKDKKKTKAMLIKELDTCDL